MASYALIPGLLSDKTVWQPLATQLEGSVHQAVLTEQTSITEMAETVLAQTPDDLIAIGHSMGARVAMEMAHIAPNRIDALVLANTGHAPLRPGEEESRQAKIEYGHREFEGMVAEWLPPMVAPGSIGDESLMSALTDMALRQSPEIHENQIRALISRPDATAYLPDIRCPVLLMTGAEDRWSPVAQHREMAALIPNSQLHVLDDAGHFMPVEQPIETAAVILHWLSEVQEISNV